jgi:(p)ppGpp synthase/HD superfamily hydrolase
MGNVNEAHNSGLVDRAIELAAIAHRQQVRKGTDIPYITHPCAVGMMLARAGCSEEVIAAGILHDTVEDTWVTLDYIREQFGERVASIVEGCSEPNKTAPWEERKQHTLQYLSSAPWEVRVVACADKLHNLRSIARDYLQSGPHVWDRFKRGRAEQEWYYRGLAQALCTPGPDGREIPFARQFKDEVERLFGGPDTRDREED